MRGGCGFISQIPDPAEPGKTEPGSQGPLAVILAWMAGQLG